MIPLWLGITNGNCTKLMQWLLVAARAQTPTFNMIRWRVSIVAEN